MKSALSAQPTTLVTKTTASPETKRYSSRAERDFHYESFTTRQVKKARGAQDSVEVSPLHQLAEDFASRQEAVLVTPIPKIKLAPGRRVKSLYTKVKKWPSAASRVSSSNAPLEKKAAINNDSKKTTVSSASKPSDTVPTDTKLHATNDIPAHEPASRIQSSNSAVDTNLTITDHTETKHMSSNSKSSQNAPSDANLVNSDDTSAKAIAPPIKSSNDLASAHQHIFTIAPSQSTPLHAQQITSESKLRSASEGHAPDGSSFSTVWSSPHDYKGDLLISKRADSIINRPEYHHDDNSKHDLRSTRSVPASFESLKQPVRRLRRRPYTFRVNAVEAHCRNISDSSAISDAVFSIANHLNSSTSRPSTSSSSDAFLHCADTLTDEHASEIEALKAEHAKSLKQAREDAFAQASADAARLTADMVRELVREQDNQAESLREQAFKDGVAFGRAEILKHAEQDAAAQEALKQQAFAKGRAAAARESGAALHAERAQHQKEHTELHKQHVARIQQIEAQVYDKGKQDGVAVARQRIWELQTNVNQHLATTKRLAAAQTQLQAQLDDKTAHIARLTTTFRAAAKKYDALAQHAAQLDRWFQASVDESGPGVWKARAINSAAAHTIVKASADSWARHNVALHARLADTTDAFTAAQRALAAAEAARDAFEAACRAKDTALRDAAAPARLVAAEATTTEALSARRRLDAALLAEETRAAALEARVDEQAAQIDRLEWQLLDAEDASERAARDAALLQQHRGATDAICAANREMSERLLVEVSAGEAEQQAAEVARLRQEVLEAVSGEGAWAEALGAERREREELAGQVRRAEGVLASVDCCVAEILRLRGLVPAEVREEGGWMGEERWRFEELVAMRWCSGQVLKELLVREDEGEGEGEGDGDGDGEMV